jgi:hypothetical protein
MILKLSSFGRWEDSWNNRLNATSNWLRVSKYHITCHTGWREKHITFAISHTAQCDKEKVVKFDLPSADSLVTNKYGEREKIR